MTPGSVNTILVVAIIGLALSGSILAMAEASISRMSRVRAMALHEEGRRNAALLERVEHDPTRYLNSIYLAVMFAQNGSAVLVAVLAERLGQELGVTIASIGFTLLYFITVEAMSKTYAILHSDGVALFLAPIVVLLSRFLAAPTRLLIAIANWLLPGKGIRQGPFVSEEEIRSMADVGHEEGAIETDEREMIHSIFEFGDTLAREVMRPRPDMITVQAGTPLREALDIALDKGYSRIPVFREHGDDIVGVLYAKDMFRDLARNGANATVGDIMRPAYFVPDTKRIDELLKEMRQKRVHMAIVTDEYGDVAGLVTLEDLIEEIVGEITDEYDVETPDLVQLDANSWRVKGSLTIDEVNDRLDSDLPADEWDTVGGLVYAMLGRVPEIGDDVEFEGFVFRVDAMDGRRIASVVIRRKPGDELPEGPGPA